MYLFVNSFFLYNWSSNKFLYLSNMFILLAFMHTFGEVCRSHLCCYSLIHPQRKTNDKIMPLSQVFFSYEVVRCSSDTLQNRCVLKIYPLHLHRCHQFSFSDSGYFGWTIAVGFLLYGFFLLIWFLKRNIVDYVTMANPFLQLSLI